MESIDMAVWWKDVAVGLAIAALALSPLFYLIGVLTERYHG